MHLEADTGRYRMNQNEKKREELLDFLDSRAFDPVLKTSPDRYNDEELRSKFEDVRRSTESEKHRFHENYRTPSDVKNNYLSDLTSRTAKKKNAELEQLGLPQLPQLRDEFMDLCNKLGIK
jgi:hypothetical protein